MMYFKVIQNGTITNVGYVFLHWNEEHQHMFVCGPQEAQFLQSFDESRIYTAEWLTPAPPSCTAEYENATIISIPMDEYLGLRETLTAGLTPVEPEPAPVPHPEIPEPSPDMPMSVQEMRQTIMDQREQIEMLTNCILEMSEIIYGEGDDAT